MSKCGDCGQNPCRGESKGGKYDLLDAASTVISSLWDWLPKLREAEEVTKDKPNAEARTRHLAWNNGHVRGAVQSSKDLIIGPHYKLNLAPVTQAINGKKEVVTAWSKTTEAQWKVYAGSKRIDAQRRKNFVGLMRLVVASEVIHGDAVVVKKFPRRDEIRTAFHVVDPTHMETPPEYTYNPKKRIVSGVELTKDGAPIAYHFRQRKDDGLDKYLRVPAFKGAWQHVIHEFVPLLPDQPRGVSRLTSVLATIKQLQRYQDAELGTAILGTMFMPYFTSPLGADLLTQIAQGEMGNKQAEREAKDGLGLLTRFLNRAPGRQMRFGGKQIPALSSGDEVKAVSHPGAAKDYDSFVRSQLQMIASATGLSYEKLTSDYTNTTYSSARAALDEAWRFVLATRAEIAGPVATQMFQIWLDEMVLRGLSKPPVDYWTHKQALTNCVWIGAAKGHIDPLKEARAAQIGIAGGTLSRSQLALENGHDFEELVEQLALEQQMIEEAKLRFPALVEAGVQPSADELEAEN